MPDGLQTRASSTVDVSLHLNIFHKISKNLEK